MPVLAFLNLAPSELAVIVVDEAATSGLPFYLASDTAPAHTLLTLTGGAIGQGLPCETGATGAQGSAILWSAASGIANASTGTAAGNLAKARVDTDATVDVILNK